MEKRKIRMIGLDMDGTVLNNKKIVTPHTREVLAQAIREGVVVLPVTGRPAGTIPKEMMEIQGIRYAVTSNGARIVDMATGKAVQEELIPWEVTERFVQMVREWEDCVWEVYLGGVIYMSPEKYVLPIHSDMEPEMIKYLRTSRNPVEGLFEKMQEHKVRAEKLHMLFQDTNERNRRMEQLREIFPQLWLANANSYNIEMISAKAGKGKALLTLGETLGIQREEIMGCGDASNDWDMLEKVGFPVVMENGDKETKKLAQFVTRSNEEDGVAYAVEQFVLALPYQVELAGTGDVPEIMRIIAQAQEEMRQKGIPQWQDGYPCEDTILDDIQKGTGYVVRKNTKAIAFCALHFGEDPTYQYMEGGEWQCPGPYGTVHRIVVDQEWQGKGVAKILFDRMERICREQKMESIRIDTHRKNGKMQEWIRKQKLEYRGTIYVKDGTPRDAFEKPLHVQEM